MAKKFTKLTRNAMRGLAPGQKIMEHGIVYERLKAGDGRYSINVMVDGRRIHRVVGRDSEGLTRTQVEAVIEKLRTDARTGRFGLPSGRKVPVGFKVAAEAYLNRLERSGGKDLAMKRTRLNLSLVPFFGNRPLASITTFDIERYKKWRAERPVIASGGGELPYTFKEHGARSSTINRELAVLSHLFSMAVEWGWMSHRPAMIRRLKEPSPRLTYLTAEQVAELLNAAEQDDCPYIYAFILIGLQTSMRQGEILSIRKSEIDCNRLIIHIPKAKAGSREQPITESLASYLQEYLRYVPEDSPWLFPSAGSSTGHVVNVRKPFRRVVQSAGLNPDEVVRHTLRHTVITHLVQAGVDLPTVKRISGHKTLAMVERYAHSNGAHIAAAMGKLEQKYGVME